MGSSTSRAEEAQARAGVSGDGRPSVSDPSEGVGTASAPRGHQARLSATSTRVNKTSFIPARSSWHGKSRANTVFFEHRMCVDMTEAPRVSRVYVSVGGSQVNDIQIEYQTPRGTTKYSGLQRPAADDPTVSVVTLGPGDYISQVGGVWEMVNNTRLTRMVQLWIRLNGHLWETKYFGSARSGPGLKEFSIRPPAGFHIVGFFGGRRRRVDIHNNISIGPMHTIGVYYVNSEAYRKRWEEVQAQHGRIEVVARAVPAPPVPESRSLSDAYVILSPSSAAGGHTLMEVSPPVVRAPHVSPSIPMVISPADPEASSSIRRRPSRPLTSFEMAGLRGPTARRGADDDMQSIITASSIGLESTADFTEPTT